VSDYPNFAAAIDGLDVDELAARAGLNVDTLRELIAGGLSPTFAIRDRLARALDANPIELFRREDFVEEALADAPTRYVTHTATLRLIERALDERALDDRALS
jgi:transcriptional regulator with XRE-family HTH domain